MSLTQPAFPFSDRALLLARAIGAPSDGAALALASTAILSCTSALADLLPAAISTEWHQLAAEFQRSIALLKANETHASGYLHLDQTPANLPPAYKSFVEWRPPLLRFGAAYRVHALLGQAVLAAASSRQTLGSVVINGCWTLLRACDRKGTRSHDWNLLADADVLNTQVLKALIVRLGPQSPAFRFAAAALAALETRLVSPELLLSASPPDANQKDGGLSVARGRTGGNDTADVEALDSEQQDSASSTPDIAARLAAADYSFFSEKLGLHHRDQLLVEDLAHVTRQLARHFHNGTPLLRGYARLAIFSLVTACTDHVALQLEFEHRHSIWLDRMNQAWAWDFRVYRQLRSDLTALTGEPEPVYCPWPAFLTEALEDAFQRQPGTKTLRDVVLLVQRKSEFDLKAFRVFLRSCGHPAHPPYSGRFARSMAAVYLEETQSDMSTGLMTGSFAAVAPSALFYFGPTYIKQVERVGKVYARLGLGEPAAMCAEGRAACQKVLDSARLTTGWRSLVEALDTARLQALQADNTTERTDHCNKWMALSCAGVVIQSAHRSSRLDRLTFAALYAHPRVLLVDDKEEQKDRAQPRLIPRTAALGHLLAGVLECHEFVRSMVDGGEAFSANPNAPVFVQWSKDDLLSPTSIETAIVEALTQTFFGSKANFGRSNWVTYLDESDADRWLIRSATGHTRDVTRTHGSYFDVPPLTIVTSVEVRG